MDKTSLNEVYLSMRESVIDVTKMDSNGISDLKQFVYEHGETGDLLKLNVSLPDEQFVTNAVFVEDGS